LAKSRPTVVKFIHGCPLRVAFTPVSFGANRARGTHPHRWKTATFLVALQQPHNGAALARRSDRRERFRSYVEQKLILTLSSPTTSLPGLYLSFKASDPIFASGESK
jgi:hypothetical protein